MCTRGNSSVESLQCGLGRVQWLLYVCTAADIPTLTSFSTQNRFFFVSPHEAVSSICAKSFLKGHCVVLEKIFTSHSLQYSWGNNSNPVFSEENKVPEHGLKLKRWQGQPHVNKVKESEIVFVYSVMKIRVCLFSLKKENRLQIFKWTSPNSILSLSTTQCFVFSWSYRCIKRFFKWSIRQGFTEMAADI